MRGCTPSCTCIQSSSALLRAQGVDALGAEHVDEEALGLVEVGHGDADVVRAAQAGDPGHDRLLSMIGYIMHAIVRVNARRLTRQFVLNWIQSCDTVPTMPKRRRLETGTDWIELSTTAAGLESRRPGAAGRRCSAQLHLIRAFEETVLELAGEGLVHGPAHSSIGQEGGAVGSIVGLRSADGVNGSHRGHHQFLAKALTHVTGGSFDLGSAGRPPRSRRVLQRTLAEILGLAQGFCRGRGGSMHLQWLEAGALGTNAIVGGGAPDGGRQRLGAEALAAPDDITINYFGDGASQIGSVLESMNLAAAWKLPVCFFIENNLYAVSTHVERGHGRHRASRCAGRASASRAGGSTAWTRSPCTWRRRRPPSACARARARRSSRPRSTASSTRTARTRAARSATAPKTKRRSGARATRSTEWRAR